MPLKIAENFTPLNTPEKDVPLSKPDNQMQGNNSRSQVDEYNIYTKYMKLIQTNTKHIRDI